MVVCVSVSPASLWAPLKGQTFFTISPSPAPSPGLVQSLLAVKAYSLVGSAMPPGKLDLAVRVGGGLAIRS